MSTHIANPTSVEKHGLPSSIAHDEHLEERKRMIGGDSQIPLMLRPQVWHANSLSTADHHAVLRLNGASRPKTSLILPRDDSRSSPGYVQPLARLTNSPTSRPRPQIPTRPSDRSWDILQGLVGSSTVSQPGGSARDAICFGLSDHRSASMAFCRRCLDSGAQELLPGPAQNPRASHIHDFNHAINGGCQDKERCHSLILPI
jgi:hypothetical protein